MKTLKAKKGRSKKKLSKSRLLSDVETPIAPPVVSHTQELPLNKLSWENFQKICCCIVNNIYPDWAGGEYGEIGQKQHGIDIYFSNSSSGKLIVWQVKRYKALTAADINNAVSLFLKGKLAKKAVEFVLAASVKFEESKLVDEYLRQTEILKKKKIKFRVQGITELSKHLKKYPELVNDYFGLPWVEVFNGKEAADLFRFQPQKEWFDGQCKKEIANLQHRYTPELNVQLPIAEIFDFLGRTDMFKKKLESAFDTLFIAWQPARQINSEEDIIKSWNVFSPNKYDELYKLFIESEFAGTETISTQSFERIIAEAFNETANIYRYFSEISNKIRYEKCGSDDDTRIQSILSRMNKLKNCLYTVQDILLGQGFPLVNNPYLLLSGKAGVGKSHLLGDVIEHRMKLGYESIFFLGQQFSNQDTPWSQMSKMIPSSPPEFNLFLKALNSRATKEKKRIIIFIDAINEGQGRYFWNNHIAGLIKQIKSYSGLGLVISIRSTYKQTIFGDATSESMGLVEYEHMGFSGFEQEASTLFFSYYELDQPATPILHPEFSNPLFLKLFCKGTQSSGRKTIPVGEQSIISVFNTFIAGTNKTMAGPTRFDYSTSIPLVRNCIEVLLDYKQKTGLNFVPYSEALDLVHGVVHKYITRRDFLEELISEGVLYKEMHFDHSSMNWAEGVNVAYERLEDHIQAAFLLRQYPNLKTEFKHGGQLYKYVNGHDKYASRLGLMDAFAIQIPEVAGKELFDYVPITDICSPVISAVVNSLVWRKIDHASKKLEKLIDKCFDDPYLMDSTREEVLSVATTPDHHFNAIYLHNKLMRLSMADRDADWTQWISQRYESNSVVTRLVDWSWNPKHKSFISDEATELASITLAWFLTSTDRKLRDCSTKALVCLLENRMLILIRLLKMFEGVDDPYIYERLFAVAYGCAVRTTQREALKPLCEYIFVTIFDKNEVFPNILIRDYARGVIEFSEKHGVLLGFDIKKTNPPYKSKYPRSFPSNETIQEKYEKGYFYNGTDPKFAQHLILSSMEVSCSTRYGYGDFGRYIFEHAINCWKNVDSEKLSNLAIKWIFTKYGWKPEKHGSFDLQIGSGRSRSTSKQYERIGKKYQWIAFHELLARLTDRYPILDSESSWDGDFENYRGPWSPFIRDIDPTVIHPMSMQSLNGYDASKLESKPTFEIWSTAVTKNWNNDNVKWLSSKRDLPNFKNVIELVDPVGERWLVLIAYLNKAEPAPFATDKWACQRKSVWTHIRSYLVPSSKVKIYSAWMNSRRSMGIWRPEENERYELFNREYYWSDAFNYFQNEYYGGPEWRNIVDPKTGMSLTKFVVTGYNYRWEAEKDYSDKDATSLLKPCKTIFEGMGLLYSDLENEYCNEQGDVVCFAQNCKIDDQRYLLIKKEPFERFLKKQKLSVVWTISGEKQVLSMADVPKILQKWLAFSGAYELKNGVVSGKTK